MKALVLAFAFSFTLPAFGGLTIRVEAPTMAGCLDARTATRKQLLAAALPVTTLTACEYTE